MRRYLKIYAHIFSFTLKSLMEFRLNFVAQLFYGPSYVLVLFSLLYLALSHQPNLGGWQKEEVILLFSVFHLLYTLCLFGFIKGVRHLLWDGLRTGEFDFVLTKPVNPQFLATFSRPELQHLLLFVGILVLFTRQLLIFAPILSLIHILLFLFFSVVAIAGVYFSLTTYATLGFYITRGRQISEFFDKTCDFAEYPVPIFPDSLQLIFFTFIPIALFGYVPAAMLLGKASWVMALTSLITLTVFIIINQIAWKHALRRYSSASS